MCNACAVAEAVRLRPMVCIGDVAPGGDIHPARCSGIEARDFLRVAGPGGGDIEMEVFDGDYHAEGVRADTV
jgi:hypothetical protein